MEKNKLNILMGNDSFYPVVDGVTEAMHNYLIQLSKWNNVAALAPYVRKYKDNLPYKVYRCKSMYLPIYNDRYAVPNKDKKLKEELLSKDIDIIHVHSPFAICRFATQIARKKHIPIVATFHTKYRYEFKARLKSEAFTEYFMKKIGRTLNKIDMVFVANETLVEELRSYGYKGKVSVVPLGTDFKPNSDSEELTRLANETYSLKDDEFVFLFVGRIVKVKNIGFTLKALSIVKKKNPNFKFLLAGDGEQLDELKELAEKLGLADNVKFLGFKSREDLPMLYSRTDLLLFPSTFDTFGLVKLEAASFNTATLAVENSCVSYGIVDGENGYTIKESIRDYARKLINIMNDKSKLKEVGKRAGETLYSNWEISAKKLQEKYYEIIEDNRNKRKL